MSDDQWAGFQQAPSAPATNDQWSGFKPASGESGKPVDYGTALQYGVANAVPFAHDIGSAIQAGETYLPKSLRPDDTGPEVDSGTPFSQRMAAQKQRIGDTDRAVNAQYPITSTVAPLAASVAALPFAGPADAIAGGVSRMVPGASGIVADALGAGSVGAGYGALYGAGEGDSAQDRIANAEKGATFGGIGGALAAPLAAGANKVVRALAQPAEGAARDIISENMARDQGNPSPKMSSSDATAAQSTGQPVAVADMGGNNVRRLAKAASNSNPDAESDLASLANERYADQGPRLASFLQNLHGSNLNSTDTIAALKKAGQAQTSPLYKQAMAQGANGVWNPNLASLVQSPSIQKAIRDVVPRAADDAVINGAPVVKNPFVNDQSGNLTLNQAPGGGVAIPSLQFWDYVKRGLDDQIGSAYSGGQKSTGNALTQLKTKLLVELDNAAPTYAAARKSAFDTFNATDAYTAGTNSLQMMNAIKTSDMKASLAQMTPQQRQIFGVGQAAQMAQTALNAPERRNVISMFNSPEMAQRIQLGQGPQRANEVEAFLRRESMMDMLRPAISGNSTTAKQASDMLSQGIVGMLAKGGTNPLISGAAGGIGAYQADRQLGNEPNIQHIAGATALGAIGGLGAKYIHGRNQAIMGQIAKQLSSQNPAAISAATSKIASTPPLMAALRKLEHATALGAGRNADTIQQQSPISMGRHLQPAYAKGGSVKRPTHEFLVNRLMKLAEKAKREEKKITAPILNMPDDTVTAALAKAQEAI